MSNKKPEEMDSRELMAEVLKNQRRELRHARLESLANLALLAVLLVAMMVVVPTAVRTLEHVESSLDAVDTLVVNMNAVVVDNTDAASKAMEKINAVDFDRLNAAIGSLNDVVEPLARFANAFR